MLDASCPITPLLPYLLNATATKEWAQTEASYVGSGLPVAIIITVGSALLLFAGERLTRAALFLGGALVTFVIAMLLTNAGLSALSATPTTSCVTLIAVPVVLGLLGGALMLRLETLAFSLLGFASGAAAGQTLYLVALNHVLIGVSVLNHDLMYFICILGLAIPCSILMAKYKETLMIFATAALGAVGLVPGLALLVMSRIDARFLWVTDLSSANAHRSSPFVYGQALAVLLYFPLGVAVQLWLKGKKKKAATRTEVQPYVVFQDGNTHRHQAFGYGSSHA